jgi:1-deoxy-D-xylulose-5-phosphate reductoisomerase
MTSRKRVAVLGATGSIGRQALEICALNPELEVCGLSAATSGDELVASARAHGVETIALASPDAAARTRSDFGGQVLAGDRAAVELVESCAPDVVLNAIVGAAGLEATLAAFDADADVALANKESLVSGGDLVLAARDRSGRRLLAVDSEHSALAQCLENAAPGSVEGLVITASGGPFRGRSADDLRRVDRAQALRHPTWAMGAKITIDSATLMNKGLEVIEAHHLFGVAYDDIEVVVHPQSIVHGMVRFRDGALLAHVGLPDMRVPISWALTYPQREATPAPRLDLSAPFALEFEPPDTQVFRCLALAGEAGRRGGTSPCILNAANEIAVAAFLADAIAFADIPGVVEQTLDAIPSEPLENLEQVLLADRAAREHARSLAAVAA